MIMKIKPTKLRKDRVEQFYEVFGYTIRNQLIIKLLIEGETEVKDINVFLGGELPSQSQKKISPASKICINQNLTRLKKLGVVDYYRIAQVAFWYLIENELTTYMRKYLTSKPKAHISNSAVDLWEELSNNFEIGERFKVKLLRERCNVPTLSNARLSQLLKELSNTPLLTKVSHGVYVREMNSEEE